MKNYSELIKHKGKRHLTAKANKFVWKCIDVIADQRGLTRYHQELKPLKKKLREVLYHLIIDQEMSIEQIKDLIKNRKLNQELLTEKL